MRHAAQTGPVRIGYDAALLGVVAVLICGCGGSGSTPSAPVPETSDSPASALPQRGGLVGAIDSARIGAVCGNVHLFATAVEGGLSPTADDAFDGIVAALRQPPRDQALLVLAAKWQLLRGHVGDSRTADRMLAFCANY